MKPMPLMPPPLVMSPSSHHHGGCLPPFAAQLLTLGPTIQILVSVLFSAGNDNSPGVQAAVVVVLVARGGAPPLLCNVVAHLRRIKLLVGRTGRYLLWHVTHEPQVRLAKI